MLNAIRACAAGGSWLCVMCRCPECKLRPRLLRHMSAQVNLLHKGLLLHCSTADDFQLNFLSSGGQKDISPKGSQSSDLGCTLLTRSGHREAPECHGMSRRRKRDALLFSCRLRTHESKISNSFAYGNSLLLRGAPSNLYFLPTSWDEVKVLDVSLLESSGSSAFRIIERSNEKLFVFGDTDVGMVMKLQLQFIPKLFGGVEAEQSQDRTLEIFSTTTFTSTSCRHGALCFVHRGIVMLEQAG
ncbi:hypothetical protein QTP70_008778 [Hemibagrus guttatus]|uniref:Uncharacterized protein n=1 Tax=Hemibagrus guttatus TaxID=175788 RepID=A0AAE0UTX9_9TELE|nr:hypothetical protein QTP70_008778 [Hemibagrus guttatus]